MRTLYLFLISILSLPLEGQVDALLQRIPDGVTANSQNTKDNVPAVYYKSTTPDYSRSLWLIDRVPADVSMMMTLDKNKIKYFNVFNEEVEQDGKKFYGKILLTMEKTFRPAWITLEEFRKKYTTETDLQVLFMIDDDFIQEDYSTCLVDENYILQVKVADLIKEPDMKLRVIRLLTRTPENLEKAKKIYIRGTEKDWNL